MKAKRLRALKFFKVHCPSCRCTYECADVVVAVPEILPPPGDCNCACHGFPGVVPRFHVKVFSSKMAMEQDTRAAARQARMEATK